MEKSAPQIYQELARCKDLGMANGSNVSGASVNQEFALKTHNVACDGCGLHPIIGIRYKCSVCKNYDFCETCEERQSHDHPFIKITKPENAPTVILTAVNEEEPSQEEEEVKEGVE